MDILNQLTNKFGELLDSVLVASPKYQKSSAQLNEFCEIKLSNEQAKELNEIIGMLSSSIFNSAAKAGMKLGASIVIGLLSDGGDKFV